MRFTLIGEQEGFTNELTFEAEFIGDILPYLEMFFLGCGFAKANVDDLLGK